MKTEKTMGELLAEFRAENGNPEDGEKSENEIVKSEVQKSEILKSESEEPELGDIAELKNSVYADEPDDDEEVNAEWLEVISGMFL